MSERMKYTTPAAAAHLQYIAAVAADPTAGDAGGTAAATGGTLSGYAVVWNATSSLRYDKQGNPRRDRMLPGSAKYDAAASPVQALYAHDGQKVLGSTANGSLTLTPDDAGLRFSVTLPDTTYARDVANLVRDGYVTGVSFGMDPIASRDRAENGGKVREYSAFALHEITVTGSPAFAEASVATGTAPPPTPARNDHALRLQKSRLTGLGM